MIYTIGHSNHTIEIFIELLKEYGIETIIDVRSVPKSKYSQHFNKPNLIFELKRNGIEYLDMGKSLGGRPNDESVLNIKSKIELKKIEEKQWYQYAISRLVELSQKSKIAIMCSEEDPEKCHRGYIITNTLIKKGEDVIHIRGNKTHQKANFVSRQGVLDF